MHKAEREDLEFKQAITSKKGHLFLVPGVYRHLMIRSTKIYLIEPPCCSPEQSGALPKKGLGSPKSG